ncbi:MAG: hypothetical protein KGO50_02820 [Myxococcales bacterium]|nr:hypothetical protein [Myxococcales bacterium]
MLSRQTLHLRSSEHGQRGVKQAMASGMPVFMHDVEWGMYAALLIGSAPNHVLEWGTGGSTAATLRLLPDLQRLVAVEHHAAWFERVRSEITDSRLELYLCEPTEPEPDPPRWMARKQRSALLKRWFDRCEREPEILQSYVSKPAQCGIPFDLVLVDGRARNACMRQGYELVRPGGMMVVHDAQRPEYRTTLESFADHRFLEPWVQGQLCVVRKPA